MTGAPYPSRERRAGPGVRCRGECEPSHSPRHLTIHAGDACAHLRFSYPSAIFVHIHRRPQPRRKLGPERRAPRPMTASHDDGPAPRTHTHTRRQTKPNRLKVCRHHASPRRQSRDDELHRHDRHPRRRGFLSGGRRHADRRAHPRADARRASPRLLRPHGQRRRPRLRREVRASLRRAHRDERPVAVHQVRERQLDLRPPATSSPRTSSTSAVGRRPTCSRSGARTACPTSCAKPRRTAPSWPVSASA